jgi:hypothetical protein
LGSREIIGRTRRRKKRREGRLGRNEMVERGWWEGKRWKGGNGGRQEKKRGHGGKKGYWKKGDGGN